MRHAPAGEAAEAFRSALHGKRGRRFWRSLDELSQTPAFLRYLEAEFPGLAPASGGIDRRSMLKVMAASLALAGLTGCSAEPDERAMPYVEAPEFVTPGRPKWYATAVTLAGFAQPLLGKTHVGRPVKLEGNPDHPATRGATDPFLQAALLGLYDPDRSQAPRRLGRPASWDAVDRAVAERAAMLDRTAGRGFRLVTGAVTSPTTARQIADLLARWPEARWHVHEPVGDDFFHDATRRVFGRPLDRHPRLDRAAVVVALDDDLLGPGPRQSMHARLWSERRRAFQAGDGDSRLFVAEPTPSLTGAVAAERLVAGPARIGPLAMALAAALGVEGAQNPVLAAAEGRWVAAAAAAVRADPGRALVTVGPRSAPEIQAVGLLIAERIGSLGTTLGLSEPVAVAPPDGTRSLAALVEAMAAGAVTTLAVLGANPAYTAPSALGFSAAMAKVPFRLHAGLHYDETAASSHWHLPLAHELESWSDARAPDGTASVIQPLVRPFYAVRSLHTVLGGLSLAGGSDRDIVAATWRPAWGADFESRWTEALVRGFVEGSTAPPIVPEAADRSVAAISGPAEAQQPDALALVVVPDPTVWDGRFAGNAWLQETPKPFSKLTWDNVVAVSPAFAAARGLANGDRVRLSVAGAAVVGPVWVMPGQDDHTVAVTLGYGRTRVGRAGEGLGFDVAPLRPPSGAWWRGDLRLERAEGRTELASTQLHQAMDGFDFVRTVTLDHPDASKHERGGAAGGSGQERASPSFYPDRTWESPSWGMAIDTDLCIGCNACVVACVAENNVAMVGKELVAEGREMHWLRIDHYYEGDPSAPRSHFQPVPCMHCEHAPCEMGCPVNAAVHSFDGLNLQVYNRCIGTRTCSSFCPYKVRRFNWFDYTGDDPEPIRAMRNPDVTVRDRGVMEKCTYCVQRISEARIAADIDGRPIADGAVVTACQQACPTRAITFGDVVDPATAVSRKKADPRNYTLLEEANTRPRTTYLARLAVSGPSSEEGKG